MEIKFELDQQSHHIRIPVYVNGQGPFSFIVDTGATRTTFSKSLVEKIGIEMIEDVDGRWSEIKIPHEVARVDQFGIGTESFIDEEVLVIDFTAHLGSMVSTIDGNIGHSTLRDYVFSVNYASKVMKLENDYQESNVLEWNDFSYIEDTHLVGAPLHIGSKGPFEFVVDTGAGGTLVTPEMATTLSLPLTPSDVIVRGLGGDSQAHHTMMKEVSLGSTSIGEVAALVLDPRGVSPRGALIRNGILGYPCLRDFELVIDYPGKRIALLR